MADKEEAPPQVGPEVFADINQAAESPAPPKVGDEIFSQPRVLDEKDGQPVEEPVGAEVFSKDQLEGIVAEPIRPSGGEATPAAVKHAEELGVDLSTVTPSGDKITKADVAEAYVPPATDAAKAHAVALGVDLKQISGTGKDGVITKGDVANHAAGANQ